MLAVDEVMMEPVANLHEVLGPAIRRAGARQLVRFVRDSHQADRPLLRAEHGEERLRLADGRAEVPLAVLDEQRRPNVVGVADR